MEWAASKLRFLKTSKFKSLGLEQSDISEGTYLPWSKLLEEEGALHDFKGAEEAVANHVRMCCKLGEPFIQKNEFSKRMEYLHFRSKNRT
eukprot:11505616-Alexandrium_andersonii.AAC.1